MITEEQVHSVLSDKNPFRTKGIDHNVTAINLLRERIPYDLCQSIIAGAEHDKIFLCSVDACLPYFSEEDLNLLAECNVGIEDDYFYMFV